MRSSKFAELCSNKTGAQLHGRTEKQQTQLMSGVVSTFNSSLSNLSPDLTVLINNFQDQITRARERARDGRLCVSVCSDPNSCWQGGHVIDVHSGMSKANRAFFHNTRS